MAFILVLPAILMFLFCNVYSDTLSGVNIAVVSEDVRPDSCLTPRDPTMIQSQCKPQSRYSCRYIQLVRDKSYTMVSCLLRQYLANVTTVNWVMHHWDWPHHSL